MVTVPARSVSQGGSTLIEVLVAVVILAIGLLGIAGLHTRLQVAEIEAYQRSQALILLNDVASRISANRVEAAKYVATNLGVGSCPTATGTTQERDVAEWCAALQGASEKSGASNVGSILGARGCIKAGATAGEYLIQVAWQGFSPTKKPKDSLDCGAGQYDSGSLCTEDQCRRVVSTAIYIAPL